jgi:hypothetical protein
MANPLLQQARQRKMIYFGAMVVLFTVSLIHREFVIKPQATLLQLTETGRGEVELTSSAVRLMMTGSRGLVVTCLWYTAMEKQKRSEWNELELVVKSITKLQPYFITPWLYQSWNIAFNVAVECDRPRDKYFYVSRGLELLAEGERRNGGSVGKVVIPGNPELRHFMGFIYQLKIGNSDERYTMRCLLDMSCIDPIQRNPDRFYLDEGGKEVNLVEFAKFCEKYPRLVRRLHEQRTPPLISPQEIVRFLKDNQNVPNLFNPIEKSKLTKTDRSTLRRVEERFPILPPQEANTLDPESSESEKEAVDVFLMCRKWYEYAQEPLPPPHDNPSLEVPAYDKLRYRVPKGIVTQLFRQSPARAQVYIAETLESEGFFDGDGWDMSRTFEKWLHRRKINKVEYTFGTQRKYHSSYAWKRSYDAYKDFGLRNGIYIPPKEMKELEDAAKEIRQQPGFAPMAPVQNAWRRGSLGKSLAAAQKLYYSAFYRTLSNFDTFLDQSEAESDPVAIQLRKLLFVAERKRKRETASVATLELYDEAWNVYVHLCFKYPRFAQVSTMQEDTYEMLQKSLGGAQVVYRDQFRNTAVLGAKLAFWPTPTWQQAIVQFAVVSAKENDAQEMNIVVPIRNRYGVLDLVQYYDGPHVRDGKADPTGLPVMPGAKELKEAFLFPWIQGAGLACNMSVAQAIAFPTGHEYYLLTRRTQFLQENPPDDWRAVMPRDTRFLIAQRMGVIAGTPGPPPPMKKDKTP